MRVITTLISMLLVSLLIFPVMAFAAEQPIHLFMNGKQLAAEVPPRIVKGNTLVPIRVIAESLGSKVQWDEKSRKVTLVKSDVTIQLFIDKNEALVNDKRTKLEAAPQISGGNTLLPVRFVSEQLGVRVSWDELTRSVFLFQAENGEEEVVEETVSSPVEQEEEADKPPVPVAGEPSRTDTAEPSRTNTDEPAKPNTTEPDKSNADEPSKTSPAAPAQENSDKSGTDPSKEPVKDTIATVTSISFEGDVLSVKTNGGKPKANVTTASNQVIIEFPASKLDPALKLNAKGEGTVKESSANISQIRYLLFSKESSIVRIIIDSAKKLDLKPTSIQAAADPGLLAWKISVASLQTSKDKFKVVIDPGHGGKDSGAISVTKRNEKDLVLSLATKVYKLLEQEPRIEPEMTRSTDTFLELSERTAFANEMKADLFVSIHGNSAAKESVSGTETYYYTEQSQQFANLMHGLLIKATGFPDRKVKQNDFYVIKNTTMPSILMEVGFLTSQSDEKAMFQEAFQDRVAASIVAGIKQQLNID